MKRRVTRGFAMLLLATAATALQAQERSAAGKAVYDKTCALCHAAGVAGAPRLGAAADWEGRLRAGTATLYRSALRGTPNGMPAKGGNLDLSDTDVRAAVDFMAAAGGARAAVKKPATVAAAQPALAPKPVAEVARKAAAATPESAAAGPARAVARETVAQTASDPNAFNRLLAPRGARNLAPAEDGIHDPGNAGTLALQPPLLSFQRLPRANAGNRVDWGAALAKKGIQPRWEANDPNAAPAVMDLNIVREVKGSMPDVVYPHQQHTEWLDCSNCHPAIFVPQKGVNQISMAAILLGQKCGVCHGKVAFPVSECRRCHSRNKDAPAQAAAEKLSTEQKP